jgi:hypothetical protein
MGVSLSLGLLIARGKWMKNTYKQAPACLLFLRSLHRTETAGTLARAIISGYLVAEYQSHSSHAVLRICHVRAVEFAGTRYNA